ncbi:MerR family transcriptional regulator [Desulfitobacterium sp. THU1]|uniref:MerR family transcriptional regulator n=1 Tax=Desulfitobacterium sp. THU1 TaxID=3138072 RepID=UPI00311FE893
MRYSIGEFAKLLGVTVDTIKHYESLQIIEPLKDDKNNYRYFDDYDARVIMKSRALRSLNFALDDVAKLVESDSPLDVAETMEEARLALKEQIHRNTLLLNKMTELQNELTAINSSLYKFEKKTLPGMYHFQQTEQNKLLKNTYVENIASHWMNALPYTFSFFQVETEEFLSGMEIYDYSWGQAIFENELEYVNLDINDYIEYTPPQHCLSIVLPGKYNEYLLSSSRTLILDYIKENRYAIQGDITGKLLFSSVKNNQGTSYIELHIPIQEDVVYL